MFPISLGLCVVLPVDPKKMGIMAASFNLEPEKFYLFQGAEA